MVKKAQSQVPWVLILIILALLGLAVWAVFAGKAASFISDWSILP